MQKSLLVLFTSSFILASCTTGAIDKADLKKTLSENPDILTTAIEKNPVVFIEALQNAAKNAQAELAKKKEQDEAKELEEYFEKPLVAKIRADESIRGTKNAPITLVEYSDFECPFCLRGSQVVDELLKKYDGKIQFIYKHLPLSFHEQAMISSQYYEAIRLQDEKKAFQFHDEIFKNQTRLKEGEKFLKEIAKKLKIDLKRLALDINSEKVKNRIAEDIQEAQKFGIQGTPGFLINGIPVKGAYPVEHFDQLIEKLKSKGKLNL